MGKKIAKIPNLKAHQVGAMSLFTVIVLALILSTITLGLLRISVQDARQSVDDDLSNRAFFAAESGLNDAIRFIHDSRTNPATPITNLRGNDCQTPDGIPAGINDLSDPLNGITDTEYTCQLIIDNPTTVINSIGEDGTIQIPLKYTGGPPTGIVIRWHAPGTDGATPSTFRGDKSLPVKTAWQSGGDLYPAMLKANLFWTPNSGSFTRAGINNSSVTNFYNPSDTDEGTSVGTGTPADNNGDIIDASCDSTRTDYYCEATITIASMASRDYVLRLTPIYQGTTTEISFVGATGFDDVQALVDVTGRSGDVYRRVQATVNLDNNSVRLLPTGAVNSAESICKQLLNNGSSIVNTCP